MKTSMRSRSGALPIPLLVVVLVVVLLALAMETASATCSACQYTARNCSSLSENETSSTSTAATTVTASLMTASDSVAVCDAAGKIQIDDVFCDNDECQCADGKRCASLVIGCTNIFQARSRKRCIGSEAVQRRFQKCAIAQDLTTLKETNMEADWVFFKDSTRCLSSDCDAVRQFHQSGVVQCGYLIVAWKDSANLYHFIVDGSRASDMAAGVFHYQAPFESSKLQVARISESKIQECFSLQTRNQKSGGACDGFYIQYDTAAVQFSNSDNYQLSKLSWPIWMAVVGSVAVAAAAVAAVAVVSYRMRHSNNGDGADDELLSGDLDDDIVNEKKRTKMSKRDAKLSSLSSSSARELRQRAPSPLGSEDELNMTSQV